LSFFPTTFWLRPDYRVIHTFSSKKPIDCRHYREIGAFSAKNPDKVSAICLRSFVFIHIPEVLHLTYLCVILDFLILVMNFKQ